MLTTKDIKKAAESVEEYSRFGCFLLNPKIKLLHKPTGKVVTARAIDVNGSYPNTVQTVEMGYWYPAGEFEFTE